MLLIVLHGSGEKGTSLYLALAALAFVITTGWLLRPARHLHAGWAATKLARAVAAEQQRFLDLALGSRTSKTRPADQPFSNWAPDDLPDAAEELLLQWQDLAGNDAGTLCDVATFFLEKADGRLMVLGDPGMGKTVLLTQLTLDLMPADPSTGVIPVLLSLSGFTPIGGTSQEQYDHFTSWLEGALAQRYGLRLPEAQSLVRAERILPILDGLDEMDASGKRGAMRAKATAMLATLNHERRRVVVACRLEDASKIAGRDGLSGLLHDARHVVLQPLTPQAVASYISHRFRFHEPARWKSVLAEVRRGKRLWETLCVPLYLHLAVTLYAGHRTKPAKLIGMRPDKLRNHLLAGFVPAVHKYATSERDPGGTPEQVTSWLGTIACYQQALADTDETKGSSIDLPSLGRLTHRRMMRLIGLALLLGGVATNCIVYLAWHAAGRSDISVLNAAFAATELPVAAGIGLSIPHRLTFSRINVNALRARAVRHRATFIACAWVLGSIQGLVMMRYLLGGLQALPATAALVLASALLSVITTDLVVDVNAASIRQLLRQSLGYSLLIGALLSVLCNALLYVKVSWLNNLIDWSALTVLMSLTIGKGNGWLTFFIGTRSAARHGVLPRRTAEFLDWCIDVGLLRMSGQELQFRHQHHRDWLIRDATRIPKARR
ncbi:NACHT domain-containing protein [Streptomyces sp. NPDC001604]|uniref:NACHT domain-containing protein n=1 Tax=Streptomyces sp. NPDC001604 TaxID=3364593 RepID=UPI0036B378AC